MNGVLLPLTCLGLTCALGCGEGSAPVDTGSGGSGANGGNGATGAGASGGQGGDAREWTPLITGDWQLDAGTEKTHDIHSVTLGEDIYVGAIRPIAPLGTHHTVLALGGLGAGGIIYASGVDTNALEFPPGIGLKLAAGEQIILQLHLFNATGEALTGTSGIEVVRVDPADIQDEANLFLPGPMDFSIPPSQEYSHTGTCTVSQPQTVFAIFPHMHQLGSHFKATLTVGGAPQVIHDDDYTFDHQAFLPFEPVALSPGDTVTTECTWNNTTTDTIGWGESSTTEMCFSILYRYPALSDGDAFGFCNN
jgi:copper type II ascorbate-dependent monooxygenase-like protein